MNSHLLIISTIIEKVKIMKKGCLNCNSAGNSHLHKYSDLTMPKGINVWSIFNINYTIIPANLYLLVEYEYPIIYIWIEIK